MFSFYRRARGASLVSYGLIVGLIAIALLSTLSGVGRQISSLFGVVNGALGAEMPAEEIALPYGSCDDLSLNQAGVDVLNSWTGENKDLNGWCTTTEIRMGGSGITEIPEVVGALSQLEWLYLPNNQITSVPASIGALVNLNYLYLNENAITSLPDSLGNLTALKNLLVNDNELTSLPDSVGNLGDLEYFYVLGNSLTTLPEGLTNLTNLIAFQAQNNNITSLSLAICSFGQGLDVFNVDPDVCAF